MVIIIAAKNPPMPVGSFPERTDYEVGQFCDNCYKNKVTKEFRPSRRFVFMVIMVGLLVESFTLIGWNEPFSKFLLLFAANWARNVKFRGVVKKHHDGMFER
ncbi:hypothetical protein TrST_g9908 [Triparma strigata]|uniref:Uncharacterized protein n=1 Tax=Triparma strigata TaxID=1606541 RepID=A0A9W7E227_9STRA|nr:hypothetical protein TrST_g9908 [Triparma strigata]